MILFPKVQPKPKALTGIRKYSRNGWDRLCCDLISWWNRAIKVDNCVWQRSFDLSQTLMQWWWYWIIVVGSALVELSSHSRSDIWSSCWEWKKLSVGHLHSTGKFCRCGSQWVIWLWAVEQSSWGPGVWSQSVTGLLRGDFVTSTCLSGRVKRRPSKKKIAITCQFPDYCQTSQRNLKPWHVFY